MAICLAANDGDRAAWEAWVWPALQPDADLDALNDSGGQRYPVPILRCEVVIGIV